MGSGMIENMAGCIWQGSVEGRLSECRVHVVAGSTVDVHLWRCKSPKSGSLLVEVVFHMMGTTRTFQSTMAPHQLPLSLGMLFILHLTVAH